MNSPSGKNRSPLSVKIGPGPPSPVRASIQNNEEDDGDVNGVAASSVQTLEERYFAQAASAFLEHDYKQCLVLLKYVKTFNSAVVQLTVDCSYEFWKHRIVHIADEAERKKNLDLVLGSYSKMIETSNPDLIPPSEYIRISHIYLSEGALESALEILKLAQLRGYLENITIVVQIWTITRRLKGLETETENCMLFLMNALFLEPRPKITDNDDNVENSTINSFNQSGQMAVVSAHQAKSQVFERIKFLGSELSMSYPYLHTASYARIRIQDPKIYKNPNRLKKYKDNFKALLAEGFFLDTGSPPDGDALNTWFNDYRVWAAMGDALCDTPFILLAEDSYWESFLVDPRQNEPIEKFFNSMIRYKRSDLVWDKLMIAFKVAPFNLHVRKMVVIFEKLEAKKYKPEFATYEKMRVFAKHMIVNKMTEDGFSKEDIEYFLKNKQPPEKGAFETKFERDVWLLIKAQCNIRRFILLRKYSSLKTRQIQRKEAYRKTKLQVDKAYKIKCNKLLRSTLKLWRQISKYLKLFNARAAIIIQSWWRKIYSAKCFAYMKFRVHRANSFFHLAAQINFDFIRMRYLREWNRLSIKKRNDDAVSVIISTLRTFSVSRKFYETMEFVNQAIRIHRRYNNKRVYLIWKAAYIRRRRLHATAAIRFWVRDVLRKREERIAEQKFESINYEEKVKQMKSYGKPLLKEMWKTWRRQLVQKRIYNAKLFVATKLFYLFLMKRSRNKVRLLRIRRERAEKFGRHQLFLRKYRIFNPWRRNAFALIIQRRVRSWIAKKKLARLKLIKIGCDNLTRIRNEKTFKKTIFRMAKFKYLMYRERCRAANTIKKFFRKLVKRAFLRAAIDRRNRAGKFAQALGLSIYRFAFRKFQGGSKNLHMINSIFAMFQCISGYLKRNGFKEFNEVRKQQAICQGLISLLIHKKLNKHFWIGSHHSISLLPYTSDRRSKTKRPFDVVDGLTFQFDEKPVYMNKILIDDDYLSKYKVFKSWMAIYRCKYRIRASGANGNANRFLQTLIKNLGDRKYKATKIQSAIRGYLQRKVGKSLMTSARKMHELFLCVQNASKLQLFKRISKWSLARSKARIIIQRFFRKIIAKFRVNNQRGKMVYYRKCAAYLSSLQFNKKLAKRVFGVMQVHACNSLLNLCLSSGKITLKQLTIPIEKSKKKSAGLSDVQGSQSIVKVKARNRVKDARSLSAISKSAKRPDKISLSSESSVMSSNADIIDDISLHDMASGEFQSQEFYTYMTRLKQTGTFIIDIVRSQLTPIEMNYCVSRAPTVFIQGMNSSVCALLANEFQGNKLVICGGTLNLLDAGRLFQTLLEKKDVNNFDVFHVIELSSSFFTNVVLSQFLLLATSSQSLKVSTDYVLNLRDVYLDSKSFKNLGLVSAILSIKSSRSLRSLSIKQYEYVWSHGLSVALKELSLSSNCLEELHFFGVPVDENILESLVYAVTVGFSNLGFLEFSIDTTNKSVVLLSEKVINAAKDRLYRNKKGVSVKVVAL